MWCLGRCCVAAVESWRHLPSSLYLSGREPGFYLKLPHSSFPIFCVEPINHLIICLKSVDRTVAALTLLLCPSLRGCRTDTFIVFRDVTYTSYTGSYISSLSDYLRRSIPQTREELEVRRSAYQSCSFHVRMWHGSIKMHLGAMCACVRHSHVRVCVRDGVFVSGMCVLFADL